MDGYGPIHSSPPVTLMWNGWIAESYHLSNCGWEFSVEHVPTGIGAKRLVFRHAEMRVRGVSETIDDHVLMDAKFDKIQLRCNVKMADNLIVQSMNSGPASYTSVDMSLEYNHPSMMDTVTTEVDSLFRTRESGILVPEDTVPDLLDRLLELQEPSRQERLKAQVRESNKEVMTIPTKIYRMAA